MKKFILIFALLSVPIFASAKEIQVTVKGMVCGFCAQGITKKFNAESAVRKVDVSLKNKLVTLDLKDGQNLTDNRIETLLKESGYNVEKIERVDK